MGSDRLYGGISVRGVSVSMGDISVRGVTVSMEAYRCGEDL